MRYGRTTLVIGLCAVLAACAGPLRWPGQDEDSAAVTPVSTAERGASERRQAAFERLRSAELRDIFARIEYDLSAVRAGDRPVPRLTAVNLPSDLGSAVSAKARKELFLELVLPAVLHVNEEILRDRRHLERLHRERNLTAAERAWLADLADRYEVSPDTAQLLRRVDVVPPSIALAQAAIESGWGTSRFAREGNALFGQRVFGSSGLVPRDAPDSDFRVQRFDSILESVRAYVHNLNTFALHREFRERRAALRLVGTPIGGDALAVGLRRYAEQGSTYADLVAAVIAHNRLDELDDAGLESALTEAVSETAPEPEPGG